MELFQNQVIRVKEMCLKKRFRFFSLVFFFSIFLNSYNVVAEENDFNIRSEVIIYLTNIKEFSSSFIQHDGDSLQQGEFFLKRNRLRVEYSTPKKIVLIVKENNAMYYNIDLEEVEYFNPKKTPASIFFNFFYDEEYLKDSKIYHDKNFLAFEKTIVIDDNKNLVKFFFEKSPLKLRKIQIKNSEGITSFTIINPNYNPDLNDKLFSLANPLLS